MISTPTGMGDVAHSRGSNIDDLGFTCTRYNFDVRSLGEPAQKSRSKPCSRADNFSSWLPTYSCCSPRHLGTEIRPQVFRKLIVPRGLNSAGFHGFQSIQTVTLSSGHRLRLFLVFEFVLPIRTFLMTIASNERIKLELSAQAVWQFPSFSREEV